MTRITPYRLLLLGLVFFAAGLSLHVFRDRGELFALARLGMAISFFGAFLQCLHLKGFRSEHRVYVNFFIVLLFYAALMGGYNFIRYHWVQGIRVTAALEVAYLSMLAFGLVLLTLDYAQLRRVLQIILGGSVAIFVLTIPRMDSSVVLLVETRGAILGQAFEEAGGVGVYQAQMSMTYIFSAMFLAGFAFRLNFFWRFLAVGALGFVVITALYYSKRATTLDFFVIVCIFTVFHGVITDRFSGLRKFQFIGFAAIGLITLIIGLLYFGETRALVAFERIIERSREFFDPQYDISEFSRIREVEIWFAEQPVLHRFLGGGPMNYHRSGITGNVTTGMHLGWPKLFAKGGPILVCMFAFIYFRNFTTALRYRKRPSALVGLTLPLYFAFSMCHSSVFDAVPGGFAVALSLYLYPALLSLENRHQAPMTADMQGATGRGGRYMYGPPHPRFRRMHP